MINPRDRIEKIQKEIVRTAMLESPGALLIGLSLYALFIADGDAFLEILNNETVVKTMLFVGVMIMTWGATRIVFLSRELASLRERNNL